MALDLGTLYVKLDAITSPYRKGMSRAESRLDAFQKKADAAGKKMMNVSGKFALGVTAPLAAATYQAGRFESAMLDVAKVTDKVTAKKLSEPILEMSENIPLAATELASLAEQAGRFGIQGSKNIQKFTDTAAKMSVATDLVEDEAGRALAKISQYTDTSSKDLDKLGSAINELSNNFRVSSREITEAMLRSGAAMKTANVQREGMIALNATVAELSASARRAGTRLRRLASALQEPSRQEDLAEVFGSTADEIKNMVKQNPVKFIMRIARAMREGGDAASQLRDIFGETSTQALAVLATNYDNLIKSMRMAEKHYDKNTSLQREFELQSSGLLNKLTLLWSQIKHLGQSMGSVLSPAIKDIISWFKDAANAAEEFGDKIEAMNPVLRKMVSWLGTIGMMAPLAGLAGGAAIRGAGFAAGGIAQGIRGVRQARGFMAGVPVRSAMQAQGGTPFERLRRTQHVSSSMGMPIITGVSGKGAVSRGKRMKDVLKGLPRKKLATIPGLLTKITGIMPKILKLFKTFAKAGAWIGAVLVVLVPLKELIEDTASAAHDLAKNWKPLQGVVKKLEKAFRMLMVPLSNMGEAFDKWFNVLQGGLASIFNYVTGVKNNIEGISTAFKDAKDALDNFYEKLADKLFPDLAEEYKDILGDKSLDRYNDKIDEGREAVKKQKDAVEELRMSVMGLSAMWEKMFNIVLPGTDKATDKAKKEAKAEKDAAKGAGVGAGAGDGTTDEMSRLELLKKRKELLEKRLERGKKWGSAIDTPHDTKKEFARAMNQEIAGAEHKINLLEQDAGKKARERFGDLGLGRLQELKEQKEAQLKTYRGREDPSDKVLQYIAKLEIQLSALNSELQKSRKETQKQRQAQTEQNKKVKQNRLQGPSDPAQGVWGIPGFGIW